MFSKWLACGLWLTMLPAGAQTADEIIRLVVVRDKQLVERRKAFDYDLDITREKLDAKHVVTETDKEHSVVIGDNRPGYGTRAVGSPEQEAQKASREEPFELLKIIDHYTYTLQGEETVNGVPCYKIGFTPKPGMAYHNREEKVLNSVTGHLWASKADFSLIRDDGTLMHPVSVAWIFATLEEMEFHFDTMTLPNGDSGPMEVQYRYLVNIPFTYLHERDTRRMSKYRLTGTAVPAVK